MSDHLIGKVIKTHLFGLAFRPSSSVDRSRVVDRALILHSGGHVDYDYLSRCSHEVILPGLGALEFM